MSRGPGMPAGRAARVAFGRHRGRPAAFRPSRVFRLRPACRAALAAAAAVAALGGCSGDPPSSSASSAAPAADAWFEPATEASGVEFVHRRADRDRFWFPEIMGSGAAWLDHDGDGDLDLYLVQGGDLAAPGGGPVNRLYRNEGGGRFVDVTDRAGAADPGYGMGAVAADLDADGDEDLYVTNVGPDALYRNEGDGSFTRIDGGAGDPGWGASGAALDYDADGDLDLFVVRYVTWSPAIEVDCYGVGGGRDYCHPSRYQTPVADRLLRNDGGLRFTDVSAAAGLGREFGNGLGVAVLDFDGDRRLDVFVANDGMPNQLWLGAAAGRFDEQAVPRGCAVNGAGAAEAGMGVAVGDVDGDGRFELFLTHLARESNTLYRNRSGMCEDATAAAGLAAPSLPLTGFGTAFADFDHDGRLDLFVANGRVGREDLAPGDPFAEPNQVYRGLGGGRFEPLAAAASGVGLEADNSRGAAFADFDEDGDVDVVVANNAGRAELYRNRSAAPGWVRVRFDRGAGPEPVGARLRATAGGVERWRPVTRAYSYLASHDPRVHFGLGGATRVDELRLVRLDGSARAYRDLPAARTYRISP